MNLVEFLSRLLLFKNMLKVPKACGRIPVVVAPSCFFKIMHNTSVKLLMVVARGCQVLPGVSLFESL
jgi:hypothetical protein